MTYSSRSYAAKMIADLLFHQISYAKSLLHGSLISKQKILPREQNREIRINIKNSLPQKDLIQELAYGVARYYFQIDYIVHQLLKKPTSLDPVVYALILMGIYQLLYSKNPSYAIVNETVQTAEDFHKSWAKPFINGLLRNFLRNREPLLLSCKNSLPAHWAHPLWMIEAIKADWPSSWENILFENNQHPPMSLRINQTQITRDNYLTELSDRDIKAKIHPLLASGLLLEKPIPLEQLPGFWEGKVSVQDIAAQWAPTLLDLKKGQKILDACAAPGGKLTHCLEVEPHLEKIVAIDAHSQRLERITENLKRLRITFPVQLIATDVRLTANWWDKEPFDRILLDVPCSATGVIRRHPDIKLLRRTEDIVHFHHEQLTYLESLWPLLKQGGKLLYITCSIFRTENESVIDQFLKKHANDASEAPIILPGLDTVTTSHGKQILTGQYQMDGFYYALLQKRLPHGPADFAAE